MYLYTGKRTLGLKKGNFRSFMFAILPLKDFQDPLESENIIILQSTPCGYSKLVSQVA